MEAEEEEEREDFLVAEMMGLAMVVAGERVRGLAGWTVTFERAMEDRWCWWVVGWERGENEEVCGVSKESEGVDG